MSTACCQQLTFWKIGQQEVSAAFDGGRVVTDAGLLSLRAFEKKLGVLRQFRAAPVFPLAGLRWRQWLSVGGLATTRNCSRQLRCRLGITGLGAAATAGMAGRGDCDSRRHRLGGAGGSTTIARPWGCSMPWATAPTTY